MALKFDEGHKNRYESVKLKRLLTGKVQNTKCKLYVTDMFKKQKRKKERKKEKFLKHPLV